jgi:hypothetical protein
VTCPCIDISRHLPKVYEWAVAYDIEKMDGDLGETSIADCLVSALAGLPDEENLVEIRYRGVHMGTYHKRRVDDSPGEIAAIIAETYGALTYNN